jgi:hypothetical protein
LKRQNGLNFLAGLILKQLKIENYAANKDVFLDAVITFKKLFLRKKTRFSGITDLSP